MLGKAEYKVAGGKLVRAMVEAENGVIRRVRLTGDFFIHPEDFIEVLEEALRGQVLDEEELADFIRRLVEAEKAVLLGVSPEDFAKCVVMAGEQG